MSLYRTDRQQYNLQQYFLRWAPGIPPVDIRRRMLGLQGTDLKISRNDSSLLFSKARLALDSAYADGTGDGAASSQSENAEAASLLPSKGSAITTTPGTLPRGHSSILGSGGAISICNWASDDMQAANQASAIPFNDQTRGKQLSLELKKHILGRLQPRAPGLIPGLVITSADNALRSIQEVKCSEEIEPTIDAVTSWAATATSEDLRDFNKTCEIYPYTMWVQPYLPQLDYSELLTVLPYIKPDYKQDGRKSIPYINLEAAHLLGMMWSKLFARGVLTLKTYSDGLLELVRSNTYVHWDILDTVLTTRLDELIFIPGERDLAQYLTDYRDHVRENKLRQLERMDEMDSEGWH